MNTPSSAVPHFLRFARAVALVSSATLVTSCAAAVDPTGDARSSYDGAVSDNLPPPGIQNPPDTGILVSPDVFGIGNPPDSGPSRDVGVAQPPDAGRDGIENPPDAGALDGIGGPDVPPEYPHVVWA